MRDQLTRRDALKLAAGTGLAMALGPRDARADEAKPIGMGFIGVGSRGTSLMQCVLEQDPAVNIPAICDIDEKNLNRALDLVEKARGKRPEGYSKGPEDYRRLLARDDINAVLIATPHDTHAAMATDSMKAGKFVGSEVPACCTVDECWELVKTHEQTKSGYMMLENLCYIEPVMQILNMAKQGLFGDLTYAFGAYIHNVAELRFKSDGSLTWRGENVAKNPGNIYPTHALGPLAWWMGVDGTSDRMISMVAMQSKSAARHAQAAERFGPDSSAAKVEFLNGDTTQCLIKTAKGRLIELRYDTASPRPQGMGTYSLQGTRGAYESVVGQRLVYLEGKSESEKWEPLEKYKSEYQHPRWKQLGDKASKAGHGGGDFFVIEDFLNAIRTGKSPIDIYDAVAWTVIRPLSALSIERGSAPVEIPDFRKPRPA